MNLFVKSFKQRLKENASTYLDNDGNIKKSFKVTGNVHDKTKFLSNTTENCK